MHRGGCRKFKRRRFWAAFCAAVLIGLAASAQTTPRHFLRGQVPAVVAGLTPAGRLPATNQLNLSIGLPLRNQAALDDLLRQLYDPGSTNFHKFLTSPQFTARFGPTEQDYRAVQRFVEGFGLTVVGTYPNRVVLDVHGSVAEVERAFGVTLRVYHHPTELRDYFAPDSEPSVPTNLPVADLWGLSDYAPPTPLAQPMPAAKLTALNYNGSGPSGSYQGRDFRHAYAPGVGLVGSGQVAAVAEFDGYYQNDIATYEANCGYTNVPLTNILLNVSGTPGYSGQGANAIAEVSLDIELQIAMAPGLSKLMVYEGNNPYTVFNKIATDNTAKQISCSWSWNYGPTHKWLFGHGNSTLDAVLSQMAAQGQSFFQASGDSDAYTGSQSFSSSRGPIPVDSIYVTSVGGTTLTMSGGGSGWASETVWNWGNNTGSGGGVSSNYTIPYWQTNVSMAQNHGSTAYRNVPDVALTADAVEVVYNRGSSGIFGGTSCAAPLWAGFTALVNQQAAAAGDAPAGFLNPALYNLAAGPNYTACFHDITTGNNIGNQTPGLYSAADNYDLATGLGTPNGANLINALAPPTFPFFNSQPSSRTVTNGANVSFTASAGGQMPLSYQWRFNDTNLPAAGNVSGVASNTLTLTAVTSANTGNYSVFVTNSHGAITSSVAALTIIFPPAFITQPTNQTVAAGSDVTFSATVSGATPLAYQWQRNGANLVNGGNLSGAATNTLTITAATTTNAGNYVLLVTNLHGSATSSVATLTVDLISPAISVASSENPSGFKDNLIFTASVSPTNATGTIQFLTNGAFFDLEPLAAGTAAGANLALLPRGTNLISAIYTGDANDLPATNTFAQIVTNHPPAASDAFYERQAGYPLDIAVADLATNWSDADGDTVSLAGIGISTNGVTVTNDAGTLVYFDTNDVDDEFVCTLTDGWGGTNFQTIHVSVVLTNTIPNIIGVGSGSDGSVTLSLAGAPDHTYILEATTNLLPPAGWLPLNTNTLGTNGVWQFTDTEATNFSQRFYRLMRSQ